MLDGLTEAVVTADRAGLVTLVNAMATALLPEIVPGTDLRTCPIPAMARSVRAGADSFDAEHGGRRLRGVRRDLADGRHAWYVRDVTEEHGAHRGARASSGPGRRSSPRPAAASGCRSSASRRCGPPRPCPSPTWPTWPWWCNLPPLPAEGQPHWIRYDGVDPAPATGLATWSLTGSLPGLAEALAGHAAGPAPWPDGETAGLSSVLPPDFGRPGTVLVSPMRGAGRTTGALVLVRRVGRAGFAGRDIELAREFAARAGAALGAAELDGEQVHLARVLQNSLLPPDLPAVPGATLAGGYLGGRGPAAHRRRLLRRLPHPGGGAIFALGDVAGKGVGAAVLTGRVRQSLRTLRLVEQRPLELMRLLNEALFRLPGRGPAAASSPPCCSAPCTPRPAAGAPSGSPAAATRPLWSGRRCGRAVLARRMPVGALAAARFAEAELCLGPGELLLAYTDGVVEARGGPGGQEMFGEERWRGAGLGRRAGPGRAGRPAPRCRRRVARRAEPGRHRDVGRRGGSALTGRTVSWPDAAGRARSFWRTARRRGEPACPSGLGQAAPATRRPTFPGRSCAGRPTGRSRGTAGQGPAASTDCTEAFRCRAASSNSRAPQQRLPGPGGHAGEDVASRWLPVVAQLGEEPAGLGVRCSEISRRSNRPGSRSSMPAATRRSQSRLADGEQHVEPGGQAGGG